MISEREFVVEYRDFKSFMEEVRRLEDSYHGLMIRAEVVGSIAKIVMLCGIGAKDIYVNVWDCRATLIIGSHTEKDLDLSEEQKQILEEWKHYVVVEENEGAYNWSGAYFPSHESLQVLKAILENNLERARMTLKALRRRR
jgi:hypothetical protein